ncbi:hypothetical protein [Papillibacter cinnamivorans]|uniref:DRTGG domain-containing protein n=1 Tax=Papillibacter cinnamivorans DSM 12816 TaxID=1122930 RepID=A0A1W2A4T8_9FIRM|nr:hypothetical protein [Papillibacter cinnamivorans]SMC55593.1 hypothetical protein SAMN02745168_1479 [Papillibacter cinnamivorans DSM 12816]
MTVLEYAKAAGHRVLSSPEAAARREITGCYICDLLSWAMGRCRSGDMWITVQNNLNVAAVAALTDAACVLIPEGIEADPALVEKAGAQEVVILSGQGTSYEIACNLKDAMAQWN